MVEVILDNSDIVLQAKLASMNVAKTLMCWSTDTQLAIYNTYGRS